MAAFPPILGDNPKILVLGSMPSQASLVKNQYYGNSRNSFWWIMSEIFKFELTKEYHSRCEALNNSGLAIWDVLHDCDRPGSLDSSIVKGTEVLNDFSGFFGAHPSLIRVVFNGNAAATLFRRHHKSLIHQINQTRDGFQWCRCPSTSPAHASMTRHDKLDVWRRAVT